MIRSKASPRWSQSSEADSGVKSGDSDALFNGEFLNPRGSALHGSPFPEPWRRFLSRRSAA